MWHPYDNNPFNEYDLYVVVEDVKKGYVKYRYVEDNHSSSMDRASFYLIYEQVKNYAS